MTEPAKLRHRLLRDELTGADSAVSNALDDYLWRMHGTASSSSGWEVFVDLLAEEGYRVVAIEETT